VRKTKRNIAILMIAILAFLMISSMFTFSGKAILTYSSKYATPLSPAANYGDLSQYPCVAGEEDQYQDGFNAGPGPNTPNVLWQLSGTGGSGYVSVFSGDAFVIAGTTLRAYNALTGTSVWNATLLRSGSGTGGTMQIDNTYLFVPCSGAEVHRISDGSFVSNYTVPYYGGMGGGAQYFPGSWASDLKMYMVESFDPINGVGYVNGISLADPTNPKLAWQYEVQFASEISAYGGGVLLVGTTASLVYALNATTGTLMWTSMKVGSAQQHGLYYNGCFYEGAATQTMTCWNATTGQKLWEYDCTAALGTRAYMAYNAAAGYGRIYMDNDASNPHGWVCCWDALTGSLLWKQTAYYTISYSTPVLAGGKLYTETCDAASTRVEAGLSMPGYRFTCFDAYTGEELWSIPQEFATPTIAYGNLYGIYGGILYCIGTPTTGTTPWSFGYEGSDLSQERVSTGQAGPTDLSYPRWVFQTGAKVSSSAAVANGKVYIGSDDHNWYCLNAYTGQEIWNFTTAWTVGASAAVVNGVMYTGADDGNIYALDANTGAVIWKTSAGGLFTHYIEPQELQQRSSPIIIGSSLYVGAMDGNLYCLNIANGNVQWTYKTAGPIFGSPVYSNGAIYICSGDTYMYALNSATGTFMWKSIPLNLDVGIYSATGASGNSILFNDGTPVVVNGLVYVACGVTMGVLSPASKYQWLINGVGPGYTSPGGADGGSLRLAAFNQTTGASVWNQTLAGNSGSTWIPTYYNGQLYCVEYLQVTSRNVTNPSAGNVTVYGYQMQPGGNVTWKQWIGYEILASTAYVNSLSGGLIYITSDVGSVTCLNATNGAPFSAYQTGANIESSPSIWESKLYTGSSDGNVYCFDDSPKVTMNMFADCDKGTTMWNNETVTIGGQLTSTPDLMTYDWSSMSYLPSASPMHPGIPNANVSVVFTGPDNAVANLTTTTDEYGNFQVTYNPTIAGTWSWMAFYGGQRTVSFEYDPAYTQYTTLTVSQAPTAPTPAPTVAPTIAPTVPPATTAPPTATATGSGTATLGGMMTYVYVGVAVILLVVIAVAAYAYTKRKPEKAQ